MKRVLIVQEKLQELTSVVKQTKNKVCTVREKAEGGDSDRGKWVLASDGLMYRIHKDLKTLSNLQILQIISG